MIETMHTPTPTGPGGTCSRIQCVMQLSCERSVSH
jgi:hypothetical protein